MTELENLPARVLAMCKQRNWSLHWTARGAYLHLEASELIEAIRGKHGDPTEEAGDVLLVLMSITEANGIPWASVVHRMQYKLDRLESTGPYPGEEREEPHKEG
jgi:NTP pyrophosphatase (non-canonical NTP hydrolase)